MKTFLRILALASPIKIYALLFFLFAFLSNLFGLINLGLLIPLLNLLFQPMETIQESVAAPEFNFSIKYFIDFFYYLFSNFILQFGKMGALYFLSVSLVVFIFLKNLFYYLSMMMREAVKRNMLRNARQSLFNKITSLHLGYFSDKRKGDLMSRFTSDVHEIEQSVVFSLDLILRDPFTLVLYFGFLFYISLKMTLFTFLVVPITGGLIALITKRLKRTAKDSQSSIGMVISILEESLGALRIIKAYNAKRYVSHKFNQENNRFVNLVFSIARTRELASPFSEFAGVMVVVGILLYGGSLILSEDANLSAAAFLTYIAVFSQVMTPIKSMSTALSNIQRGIVAGNRIFEVIDTEALIRDHEHALDLPKFEKSIEFKNVSFRYEDRWILKNISFTIEKGQKVALVGETGSGKSTIADLIPRFYDVEKGEILIDGINIKDIKLESIIQHMGIVTQEAILFNDTIYNNIAFARENADPKEVKRAAKIAKAHEFITKTSQGYDTIIGDRGMKLSGGQRQRITIARAILKNPPILILDEATSNLDTKVEKLVQEALYYLMKHRTTLVIAHRLSTIQDADKILVLKEGRIVEEGNHQTLLQKTNGIYKKLSQMQTTT
ncbi:MAG: ABC transporter ATP-binding protein [Microscillaceae bacterium]|nr:ABC transporter ATP-binding protein [Microscillaceae bacterium]